MDKGRNWVLDGLLSFFLVGNFTRVDFVVVEILMQEGYWSIIGEVRNLLFFYWMELVSCV